MKLKPIDLMSLGRILTSRATVWLACATWLPMVHSAPILVPNGSFESPSAAGMIVNPLVDAWRKFPNPGITLPPGYTWDGTVGSFFNYPGASHIDNADGSQVAYILAFPGAGISQVLSTPDAVFQGGVGYTLKVAVTAGQLTAIDSLALRLFYVDGGTNVTVGETVVPYTTNVFTSGNHLIDFSLEVPPVAGTNAWLGKPIGIELAIAGGAGAGFWDVDHVRLESNPSTNAITILETPLTVPNGSFESPATPFVAVYFDQWQKTPKPANIGGLTQIQWDQQSGIFKNTDASQSNHIVNIDGDQAVFLFASPGAGFFQDYDSTGSTNTIPDHQFQVNFEVGKSYKMTLGLLGGPESQLMEGSTLECDLYYRDSAGHLSTVASNVISYSAALFTDHVHFIDFSFESPVVQSTDPWAGKHLGIGVVSTVTTNLAGGYWDLDNVRLTSRQIIGPPITALKVASQLQLSWPSALNWVYQLQTSTDLRTWQNSGNSMIGTGTTVQTLIAIDSGPRYFYRLLVSPKL